MADDEGLSVEETNKLRAKLGLKPLEPGKGSKSKSEIAAEENFASYQDDLLKKNADEALRNKIDKARNQREFKKKLVGKSLGDVSDDEDTASDALAWINRSRKVTKNKQMELAKLKAKELNEQDRLEYTSADLKGLHVAHEVSDLQETGEAILVLKDATIEELEKEGDELLSVSMVDTEKTKKNLENKRKRPGYVAYDDEEVSMGAKRNLLSQYDEELEAPKKRGFQLDGSGSAALEDISVRNMRVAEALKEQGKRLENLDYEKMREIKDYYTADEVSFKKVKKKKVKVRVKNDDEFGVSEMNVANVNKMEVDAPAAAFSNSNSTRDVENINFVDDDDLQAALAKQRRVTTKQKTLKSVEEIFKENEVNGSVADEVTVIGGMEYSATAEFIRTLPTVSLFQPRPKLLETLPEQKSANFNNLDEMDVDVRDDISEAQAAQKREKELLRSRGGWASEPQEDGQVDDDMDDDEDETQNERASVNVGILEDEPLVSHSMSATIKLLTQKGSIDKATTSQIEKEHRQKEKELWIIDQQKKELLKEINKQKQRELDRQNHKGKKGGQQQQQERDWEKEREKEREKYREEEEERKKILEIEKRFQNYAPDINLDYYDEFGRQLSKKEVRAFRQLSHKFHGKGSGKLKTEKRLKKIQEEIKIDQMPSDPLATSISSKSPKTKTKSQGETIYSVL
ncbi:hypothetical protein HK096_000783 [Nowakowskiella sp. JEL0078]|nr:hypothetical protein HK096_000783 [Nowakowskiella sp. JEL0078]